MTKSELVQYTKRRLSVSDPATWADKEFEIIAAIPAAIHELSVRVMRDVHLRALLQQDYSVTLDANGIGNLLTATGSITGAAGEILLEGITKGLVLDEQSNPMVWIPHLADFYTPQPSVYPYYTITKTGRIHTRAIASQVPSPPTPIPGAIGPITVTASYSPASVANVPTEIEDDLVGQLVEVVLRQVGNKEQ